MSFPKQVSEYELQETIGVGANSKTIKAICKTNNKLVAIKLFDLRKKTLQFETIANKLSFWEKCHHPNVVEFYTILQHESQLWIITEFVSYGSIDAALKYLSPNEVSGFKDETLIASILSAVLQGLIAFHSQKEFHSDLRASNILLSDKGVIKVDDFGLSTTLIQGGSRHGSTFSIFGDSCYMAPEVLKTQSYSEKCDIWGLGLAAFELATGQMPYSNLKFMEGVVQIVDHPPPKLPETFSPEFRSFVSSCLIQNPQKRPSAFELINHPFILRSKGPEYIYQQLSLKLPLIHERANISPQITADIPFFSSQTNQNENKKESKFGRFTVIKEIRSSESNNANNNNNNTNNNNINNNNANNNNANNNNTNNIVNTTDPQRQMKIDSLNAELTELKAIISELESENEAMRGKIDQIRIFIRNSSSQN